ncbi:hypothetical protein [Candidatus Nitrosotenuis aquarius]|uniref:hypothetical protein n=1 Tax=Candidatus Nitrosotenuis aquarius TaxID=1846278 RepID=UPI000C1ECDA5|nr:hypothetical protein [Candidatus Nitrosotenuis aquarius]
MHYTRASPSGICSFYVITVKNTTRIFGILLTRKNKVLFSHQVFDDTYRTTYIIQKRDRKIAIC